jgi:UrcA family protein
MKNVLSATFAAATIAFAVLALPTNASAQERKTASDMSANQARVTGHVAKKHGWLTTMGPDAQGRYAVSIDVADLDANSTAGHAKIASRVEWATSILCDMTAPEGMQAAAYYDAGTRQCRDDLRASALSRISGGQHASVLTMGLRTTTR